MKEFVVFAGLMLMLLVWSTAQSAEQASKQDVTINLKEKAVVSGITYTVGDLAFVESADIDIADRLRSLTVGESPRVGYRDRVNWQTLRSQIESAFPGLFGRIRFTGAAYTMVETLGSVLDANSYTGPAREKLQEWLRYRYPEFDIKLKGKYENLQIPKGSLHIEPKLEEHHKLAQAMEVWVDILVDDKHYQSVSVRFDVEAFAPVWVSAKGMKKGNTLSKGELRRDYRDVANLGHSPVKDEQLADVRLKKDVKEGEVLVDYIIEPIPDVSKGETISVTAVEGAVTVKAAAVALEDGNVGDLIDVQKPNTDIVYQVRVTSRNNATINGE